MKRSTRRTPTQTAIPHGWRIIPGRLRKGQVSLKHLPQPVVRAELEKSMGSQLAPDFTRIMMTMIDEDVDYRLREM